MVEFVRINVDETNLNKLFLLFMIKESDIFRFAWPKSNKLISPKLSFSSHFSIETYDL